MKKKRIFIHFLLEKNDLLMLYVLYLCNMTVYNVCVLDLWLQKSNAK